MSRAGVYIHIPFCAQKCNYCDFYSVSYDSELAVKYIEALVNQIESFDIATGFSERRREADAVYFGGGTPSLLCERDGARVIDAVSRRFKLDSESEITLELNPETASPEKLLGLKAIGINRLSVGVQSTDNGTLHGLGRKHTAKHAIAAIEHAYDAGFRNISADVMLALPGENENTLKKTLDDLTKLPITHISAYLLKIADGTPFGVNPPQGIPDEDTQADIYEFCCAYLLDKGFAQYEISNFAKPGFESRQNMKYWSCDDYIGFGAAAHSCIDGKRYSFLPDINQYINVCKHRGNYGDPYSGMCFEGEITPQDYIMLRLRTRQGLDLGELYKRYNYKLNKHQAETIKQYKANGLLAFEDGSVALTVRGMLVSNSIIAGII